MENVSLLIFISAILISGFIRVTQADDNRGFINSNVEDKFHEFNHVTKNISIISNKESDDDVKIRQKEEEKIKARNKIGINGEKVKFEEISNDKNEMNKIHEINKSRNCSNDFESNKKMITQKMTLITTLITQKSTMITSTDKNSQIPSRISQVTTFEKLTTKFSQTQSTPQLSRSTNKILKERSSIDFNKLAWIIGISHVVLIFIIIVTLIIYLNKREKKKKKNFLELKNRLANFQENLNYHDEVECEEIDYDKAFSD